MECVLSISRHGSLHALSNSADATSKVSSGQATASSNGFVVATDPANPLTQGVALDPAIAPRGGKIVQVAPFQGSQTLRADRGIGRRHVVHQDKRYFVNGHLSDPYLTARCELRCHFSRRVVGSLPPRTPSLCERRGERDRRGRQGQRHAPLRQRHRPKHQVVLAFHVQHRTRIRNRSRYSASPSWRIEIPSCRSRRL